MRFKGTTVLLTHSQSFLEHWQTRILHVEAGNGPAVTFRSSHLVGVDLTLFVSGSGAGNLVGLAVAKRTVFSLLVGLRPKPLLFFLDSDFFLFLFIYFNF